MHKGVTRQKRQCAAGWIDCDTVKGAELQRGPRTYARPTPEQRAANDECVRRLQAAIIKKGS